VSKERSSRRAPVKRKVTRNPARGRSGGQVADVKVSFQGQGEYREQARSQVLAAWPQILQGLIEKAMCGGYQHTKLLLDLCDLDTSESLHPNQNGREQLCDVLLNNLQLRPPE
jgi:hypothetical protein